jgi:Glycosyl transferase family 2
MRDAPVAAQFTESGRREGRRIAVLVPCFNEAATIGQVIADFRAALPEAAIYVYDNNSSDRTAENARSAGAELRHEPRQGKGNVVRRMFADVDADVYVLVDGDATYDAPSAPAMIARLIEERLDMVVAARVQQDKIAYRRGHRAGNRLLTAFVAMVFRASFTDILSGYRVFSRRFVKSFPVLSGGFEIETELTVHALELDLAVFEIATPYYARPQGSQSKLSTWRDGFRILFTILRLYRAERPLALFGAMGISFACMSVGLAIPIFVTFVQEGLVPRLPTAILATGLMLIAFLSIASGLVLDTVTRGRREMKLLATSPSVPPARTARGAILQGCWRTLIRLSRAPNRPRRRRASQAVRLRITRMPCRAIVARSRTTWSAACQSTNSTGRPRHFRTMGVIGSLIPLC